MKTRSNLDALLNVLIVLLAAAVLFLVAASVSQFNDTNPVYRGF